ncbi:Unknown protein [Striga hermonthica]|uniref:WW domain-containing protein n=1 Tax=Striga hermonthica TaxID=68872 RepID=A0A9N7MRG9_STRHE|nr:Unknown protein [Striga hermonthica]
MATITASLERSLQNCSLNNHHHHPQSSSSSSSAGGGGGAEAAHGPPNLSASPALELNSEASLPFNWEQCLDLKTGEIYYINWRTGMKVKEDPRTIDENEFNDDCYYSEDEDSSSSYDSQGSCSETSPSSSSPSRLEWCGKKNNNKSKIEENCCYNQRNNEGNNSSNSNNNVLVVGGCKRCLMYYMVPKQLEICPKCCGQLLHFDRSEDGGSS